MKKKLISLTLAILTLALCIVPIAASAEDIKSGTLVDDVNYSNSYFPMAKSAKYTNWDNPFRVEYYYNYQSCFYLVDSVKDVFVNTKADNWEYDEAKFNTFAENDKKAKKDKSIYKVTQMPLVSFIKELGVPRAVLEKAIGKADDYLNESEYDLPYKIDLDLIYTLDNEKINAYYKYTPSDPWSEKGERKYRYCYYSWVIDLYEQFAIWDDAFLGTFSSGKAWKLIRSLYDDNFRIKEEPDEMPLVTFIKTFEIPKENLDSLLSELSKTEKYKDFLKANAGTEYAELPNLDIIYTFDNEKINEYYSVDKPFNAETGEDTSDIIVFAILGTVSLAAVTVLAKKKRT